MGLFDKIKNSVDTAQNAVNNAKNKATQTKSKVHEFRRTVDPTQDGRPYPPMELLAHQQNECIKVYGTKYHQDVISRFTGDTVQVAILKDKLPEWDSYPVVSTIDNAMLGAVYDEQVSKAGLKTGYTAIAEIHRPIFYGQEIIELYIPKTSEAIENEKLLDSLKFWGNLDASKWEIEHGKRFDFYNVEILKNDIGNEKTNYVVIGDKTKLFEVTPRMKLYKELSERISYKPRRLIVEAKDSERDSYYRVGFYY